MSSITELTQKLCPEGVPFYPLWQVTIWDKKFQAVSKEKQTKVISYSYLLAADLFALESAGGDVFLLSTGEQTGWTTEELAGDNLAEGEVVTIPWGKSRPVVDCIKYYKGKFVTADNRIATSIDVNILNNKYLYYWLMSIGKEIDKLYRGAGIQHPNMGEVLDLRIPVPPLPVQQEIVRILDTFTAMNANLEEELEARKKQYDYYAFASIESIRSYGTCAISDLGKWTGGITPPTQNRAYWTDGTIPWVTSKDMKATELSTTQDKINALALDETSIKLLPAQTVAIVARSGILKHTLPVAFIPFEATVNQDLKALVTNQHVLPKYAFYAIYAYRHDILLKTKKQGGTVDSLDVKEFMKYEIPLPSLDIQEQIVTALDSMNELSNDTNAGIPNEILLRKQQYEYYRDRLLTFKEA